MIRIIWDIQNGNSLKQQVWAVPIDEYFLIVSWVALIMRPALILCFVFQPGTLGTHQGDERPCLMRPLGWS